MTTLSDITTDPAARTARRHLERLLAAYRVTDAAARARLAAEVVAEAACAAPPDDGQPLETRAVALLQRRLATWIDTLLGPGEPNAALRFARARTALALTPLPPDWSDQLLTGAPPAPEPLRERIRHTYLAAGPDFQFSRMAPQPIDLGPISTVADGTWRTFDRWPVLRSVLVGTAAGVLLGTVLSIVRF